MITVRLQGGLGNQMFQYAIGRVISARQKTSLVLDISYYDKDHKRSFELNKFRINAEVQRVGWFGRILRTGQRKIFGQKDNRAITDNGFNQNVNLLNSPDGSILEGDWWGPREQYFIEIGNLLQKEFILKNKFTNRAQDWTDKIALTQSISIHLRRGDYLQDKQQKIFRRLELDYYLSAAKIIEEKTPNPVFYVFSDDIVWAKENLKLPYPKEFVSDKTISATEELILMSKCKHNIIANSSFSWWGAWLNPNPNKIVIAPQKWFSDISLDSENIVPNNWIQI